MSRFPSFRALQATRNPRPNDRLAPTRPRNDGRGGRLAGLAVATALFLGGSAVLATRAADDEKGVLAGLISRALSTPATRVSIGAVDGALSSDATIRNIEISDRDGVWLKLDRARIVWRRLALLQRRLEIDTLEVDHLEVARKPIPAEGPVAGADQPLLPELPVKVEIKDFKLAELGIGAPILGTAARVAANGAAKLGDPSEGLDLRLDARRLDQPGTLAARLGLVPQGQRLNLSLILDEPAGGILARAAGIPGEPPVKFDLGGSGTLDNFKAALGFNAGEGIGADGSAVVTCEGAARRFGLDLAARVSGLMPAVAAPVFAGTTKLTGNATYGDDGALSIGGIALEAAAARVDIAGTVDAAKIADLTIRARNVPSNGDRTAVSGAEIRRLAFDGRVTGAIAAPKVDAKLALEDARLPAGRLARLDGTFNTTPTGSLAETATRLQLAADLYATGIVPADPALARALGTEASLTLRGSATTKGVVDADTLEVKTATLAARYSGRLASDELRGKAEIGLGDLSRFSDVAKLRLRGAATLAADLEGTPRANRFNAALTGRVTRFASGIEAVDGLAGGRLAVDGKVGLSPTGDYTFDDFKLAGEAATARLNGTIGQNTGAIDLAAALPDLRKADPRLSGRADLAATVTGGLQNPAATARLTVAGATALGRPIPRLALDIVGRDLLTAPDARVTLDGEIDRAPARGTLHLARTASGATTLDDVDLRIGTVTAKGGLSLDTNNLASGRLTVAAGNLDDLSPLALTKLGGTLNADLALDTTGGGQNAALKADAARVTGFGASLDKLAADLRLTDVYRRPVVAGQVAIDDARVGGERVERVRLNAQGTPSASDVILTATARGFDLDARARVIPGERTRIELSQLGATRGRQRLGITSPATVTLVDGGVDIRSLALQLGSGRLTVDGTAGRRLDLKVGARAVPLSAADIVSPGLGLQGTLEGDAQVTGTTAQLAGEYRARINGLSAPQTRNAGLPPIEATANGRLANGRASIDANLAAGRAGSLRIGGSVPAGGEGALDVTVRGGIDAGAATARLLGAAGRRLTGRVDVDAKVGGTLASPQASGAATLSGGSFTDAANGVSLDAIRARVVARGEEIVIESASAATRNGGSLSASGRVRLDPGGGFPGQIKVTGTRAELVRSAIATAVLDLNLDLSGPLARDPRVSGRVDVVTLDVSIPDRLPSTLKPLANTRHVNPTRTVRARLALDERAKGKGGSPPFDAVLNVLVTAPGHIVVRGRGLNAELGGELRVAGTLAKPSAVGAFELRSGRLQIVSSRLDFSRGRLTFSGDLTPELDFIATTSAGGAAIQVSISGPASDPQFAFTSSPDLPPDEILSRILFGAPSGQLTTGQALTLATAAAQYGGDGAFEDLRKSLGLSGVDVSGGGLGLTRNLGDRFSIGVNAGVNTGVEANFRVTDEIKIRGGFSPTGGTQVGIAAEKEW